MKQLLLLITGLLLIILTACTPMIYGVPQETWNGMNEEQRSSTIEIYQQRQLARQKAAEERARQHAIYLENKRIKEAAEAEIVQLQVEAIYRGEGNYGDLIRVRVEKGMANFRGQVRVYDPVAFQIAKGETREVTFATTKNRRVILNAYYDGSTLYLDGNKNTNTSRMAKIIYDKRWANGLTYSNVQTNNKAKLKGADVTIEIVGEKRYGGRHSSSRPTTIIIKEQPNNRVIIQEQPQTVIIKEKPAKVVGYNKSHETAKKQRQRNEQLKKERKAIEKDRKELKKEQAKFKAEQQALEEERKELEEKQARIKKMKKDAARDKKHASKEKQQAIEEREQAVKELEAAVEQKEAMVMKKEQVVAKKEKQVKEKKQKVKKQEQKIEKEEKELEKEVKELEEKQKKENNGKKK